MMHRDESTPPLPADFSLSETVEDYLRLIALLQAEGRPATVGRLSVILSVTPASVSGTVHRLIREGLLASGRRHQVQLTAKGEAAAQVIWRRHGLAEWFLVDVLKVPWSDVYVEADRLEHTISSRIELQLQHLLGERSICPHGNPIHQTSPLEESIPLAEARSGAATVYRLRESSAARRDLMQTVQESGLLPGSAVDILGPDGDVLWLKTSAGDIDLPLLLAELVMVQQ